MWKRRVDVFEGVLSLIGIRNNLSLTGFWLMLWKTCAIESHFCMIYNFRNSFAVSSEDLLTFSCCWCTSCFTFTFSWWNVSLLSPQMVVELTQTYRSNWLRNLEIKYPDNNIIWSYLRKLAINLKRFLLKELHSTCS